MKEEQRTLLFKLAVCNGIGNIGMLKVLDFSIKHDQVTNFSKEDIIRIANITTYQQLFSNSWDKWSAETQLLKEYQAQHQFITILDPIFPYYLKQIYNCPVLLFYQGNIELLNTYCLSFVGARSSSVYGIKVAQRFIPEIITNDFTIVSGLAKGIDSVSHQIAMNENGFTIGVIGSGLDICYPKETAHLQRKMMQEQLVISEYPNGIEPKKYHFPMRNRIIAGLSLGTCVIEARQKSGSLITAQAALEYGREVFAVPGNLLENHSDGCHRLIQTGAKCTVCAQDILDEVKFFRT